MLSVCLAISLDGRLNTAAGGRPRFSSREDRRRLFRLRAESDLVLVGASTVREEELPPLVRDSELRRFRNGRSEHPAVAVVSRSQDLPWQSSYFTQRQQELFLVTREPSHSTEAACADLGIEILELGVSGELAPAVAKLGERGYTRILAEGGGKLVHSLLEEALVDRFHLTIAPLVMGGEETPPMARGPALAGPPRFVLEECRVVGDELHVVYGRANEPPG